MRVVSPRSLMSTRANRRTLLQGAGASLTLAAATPFFRAGAGAATLVQTPTTTDISGTNLSILLWSHFVPRHDVWFDQFVAEWGEANGVTTQVDHVNTADVPAAIAAEIAAGEGHDIVEHITSLAQYEKSVLPMNDVVEELNSRHGEQLPMAMRNSFNPTTESLLRSLPRVCARPRQLPPLALGAGRAAGWPRHLGRAAGGRRRHPPEPGRADGARDVERGRLHDGRPDLDVGLRRGHPGRERERRHQLAGDDRRRRATWPSCSTPR